jgi:hypothetical protein
MAHRVRPTDVAQSIPFDNDTNGFVSDNVQDAIEEARGDEEVLGRTFLAEFSNGGNTGNKWLFHTSTSESSDTLPLHMPFDVDIYGISMENRSMEKDVDIEFYLNGTAPGNLTYTLQVRLGATAEDAYITTLTNLFTMSVADTLSVFIRKVGGDTLSSPIVGVFFRVNSNVVGSSGVL